MIDNRAEIYKILSSVSDNVDYRYPMNMLDNNYPKVCYYISNASDTAYEDNKATMCTIDATVQVYEKNINGEIVEIHHDIDTAMRASGFKKIYYDNYFDTDDKTHLHTMRFSKIYEMNTKEIDNE